MRSAEIGKTNLFTCSCFPVRVTSPAEGCATLAQRHNITPSKTWWSAACSITSIFGRAALVHDAVDVEFYGKGVRARHYDVNAGAEYQRRWIVEVHRRLGW